MSRTLPVVSMSLVLFTCLSLAARAETPAIPRTPDVAEEEPSLSLRVADLIERNDVEGLRALGPQTLPALVFLYDTGDEARRTRVAQLLYALEWPSPEAERSLMQDIRTGNVELRLAVQYALGRISSDPQVVETLLDTLENDPSPLFRDKAACALAYDQIHLRKPEKARLYQGLIQALSNPEPQVQAVSIQALSILTGETKGFHPLLPPDRKQRSIDMWERWLAEYRNGL
jgi:hypothetical protein